MASLDEGSVGIKMLAGLPDGNGLPPLAADLLDAPRDVFAIVRLRPSHKIDRFDQDSHTVVMRLVELEPVEGKAGEKLRDQLVKVKETRTGVVTLPGIDGVEVPAVHTEEDEQRVAAEEAEVDRVAAEAVAAEAAVKAPPSLVTGPEWGDGQPDVPAEADAATSATESVAQAVAPPPFAPPTPIRTPRKRAGG